jgi:cytochrome b561
MTSSAGRTRYTAVAIALHWIIAAVIAMNFSLGLYMAQLEASPAKLRLYSYHKTIGVTIFLLVVFRLVWRLTHRVPAPPPRMPRWQRTAASISHILLYLLTLAVPLSGWLFSSASGFKVMYFTKLPRRATSPRTRESQLLHACARASARRCGAQASLGRSR